jgi:hypothetical protein
MGYTFAAPTRTYFGCTAGRQQHINHSFDTHFALHQFFFFDCFHICSDTRVNRKIAVKGWGKKVTKTKTFRNPHPSIITSSHHHIITSSHHHIITSSHHHNLATKKLPLAPKKPLNICKAPPPPAMPLF